MMRRSQNKLKIALICGGPSLERGISLNSARSVCDHLFSETIEIVPIYFDYHKNPYLISRAQLYSNTPSDFDFKLKNTSKPLSKNALRKILKSVDLAFPVMHGIFGEDGEIQRLLEKENVPYVGSGKKACQNCFDKYRSNELIKKLGFFALPSAVLKINQLKQNKEIIKDFFLKHKLKKAIIKPATGGSSIGVHAVFSEKEAVSAAQKIFGKRMDTRVVIEPFCQGIEFTVIILQNRFGLPVALFPTEIEINYKADQIFDYRKKYLASRQVTYHCPPRFTDGIIEKIQIQAEQLFKALNMDGFARFDGWLLPDGNLWFSDFNPISGMEQNSFLFLQSAQVGFSHRDLLKYIVKNACREYKIPFPEEKIFKYKNKKDINIIFGGKTAERQVSVMTGTNAWLKLRNSDKYSPHPYLLDLDEKTVWQLPYSRTLNHTVEEISETCRSQQKDEQRLSPLRKRVLEKLAALPDEINEEIFIPKALTLEQFINNSKFVFIGLHGGIGEDGTLQKILEKKGIPFNGPGSESSAICIDKFVTGEVLKGLENKGIFVPLKKRIKTKEIISFKGESLKKLWKNLKMELGGKSVIVKPIADGCSAGIMSLSSINDLSKYLEILEKKLPQIPKNTFRNQKDIIEMPTDMPESLIFEQFIYTDKVSAVKNKLKWKKISGWIEITMGILEENGKLKALNPSLTVATGEVLSVEEKFQGGTGINITPPPQPFVKKSNIEKARKRMEIVAKKLKIQGYCRIDAFMEISTGNLMIIEANTTPALTPSTVIFHQTLVENPQIYPAEFIEKIVKNKGY